MNCEVGPRREAFPGAGTALGLLLAINLLNYIDRQVLAAVVDFIQRSFFPAGAQSGSGSLRFVQAWAETHLGFKPELALIGVLGMAFMTIYTIGAPVFGVLAERYSRWALIGVGVILWSVASGATGVVRGFLALILTRCFVGVGEAAYGPAAPDLLSDFYPAERRGQVLSWFYLAIPVGGALGFVIGDMVARSGIGDWGGRTLGIHVESWRWAFYVAAAPGILLGLWSFFMKEPPRGQSDLARGAAMRNASIGDYAVLLRTPSYVLCTLGMTAMTFSLGGIAFWMAYYLKQKPQAPAGVASILGAIVVISGLSATLLGGWAGDKLRARHSGSYFLVSGVAMVVGFAFMVLLLRSSFPSIWIWLFGASFCLFFNTGPTNAIIANVTHPRMRAAGFAANIFVIHAFGDVLSPVVIGVLSDRFGMNAAFGLVSAMFIASAILWLAGTPFLKRDAELAPLRL